MDNQNNFLECKEDDVVSFGEDTFKIGKFKKAVQEAFGYDIGYALLGLLANQGVRIDKKVISPQGNNEDYTQWFDDGIDCEILKTDGQGWRKAKVKIKLELEFNPLSEIETTESEPEIETEPEFDYDTPTVAADIYNHQHG
ncbi:MAG: KGK domain-containing protein [Oscillatoria sp. PMC 1051.18]|nr:KGK domain-containing protein [Oscillatoria sp. PMC 1050.18]MEC5032417.1 KGK domain-containing protein [Oscillatoria sp. PMC 1051.18]